MQELKLLSEDKTSCAIMWSKSDMADSYIIEGVNQTFEYKPICRTAKNTCLLKKNKDYVGYRVSYAIEGMDSDNKKALIFDSTNVIHFSSETDMITIVPLRSYNGLTSLTFVSEAHYDLYRLYDSNDNLVRETEDCIVIGEFSGKSYYVSGYMKNDDQYEWKGASDLTNCEPVELQFQEKPVLSVVIPVYNSQNFLPRTMQSILSSVWHDFEIILVNDGSTDDSKQICEWYAEQYSCVRVLNQNNAGVATARNYGMDEARGEWLAFVDSDDIIHPYMYKKLYDTAIAGDYEIAIAQCLMREEHEKYQYVLSSRIDQNIVTMDSFREVMESRGKKNSIYFVAVWNKIVKTGVARKVRFWDGMPHYEDTAYTAPLYSYINRFVLVKDAYYVWDKRKRKTEGTLSTRKEPRPSAVVWKIYIFSYAASLFIGNKDKESADVYKFDIIKHLLTKYSQRNFAKPIKNVFRGMVKYLVHVYDLPISRIADTDQKLYDAWKEIQQSEAREWDGMGDIPKEYYE